MPHESFPGIFCVKGFADTDDQAVTVSIQYRSRIASEDMAYESVTFGLSILRTFEAVGYGRNATTFKARPLYELQGCLWRPFVASPVLATFTGAGVASVTAATANLPCIQASDVAAFKTNDREVFGPERLPEGYEWMGEPRYPTTACATTTTASSLTSTVGSATATTATAAAPLPVT